jgi:Ethanolamine utilization protein EutJ (predicted chaperonin)
MTESIKKLIDAGKATLGIELGSTRIKATLIGEDLNQILASGTHDWENQLEDGYWTYSVDSIWQGLAATIKDLQHNVEEQYGIKLQSLNAIGAIWLLMQKTSCWFLLELGETPLPRKPPKSSPTFSV